MAIDSAAKRRSVAHIARRWSGVGVTPDATPDQFWRQSAARGYGGILAGEAVEPEGPAPYIGMISDVGRLMN